MSILKVANVHFEATGTNRIDYLGDDKIRITSANGTVLSGSTTDALLRITQTGTGAAIRVEDSSNPDVTPFIVDANGNIGIAGNVGIGTGLTGDIPNTYLAKVFIYGQSGEALTVYNTDGVNANAVQIYGTGTASVIASSNCDLSFLTSYVIPRMRIQNTGNVLIGRTDSTVGQGVKLDVNGAINASAVLVNGAPLQTTTLTSNVVISVADNSNAALRITQTGTGDAIRVEDSTNPDATPFVVDANGKVLIGSTDARNNFLNASLASAALQVEGTSAAEGSTIAAIRNSSGSTGPRFLFAKSKGTTVGSNVLVQSGDNLGTITFQGSDGSEFVEGALITATVDGTAASDSMPTRLEFHTSNTTFITERMRIDPTGNVLIGRTDSTVGLGVKLDVNGGINASAVLVNGAPITGGATITTDTVNATRYVVFEDSTSGSMTLANVSTSLTFNPSTGTLSSTIFNSTSDETLKYDVRPIENALAYLDEFNGVHFKWKKTNEPSLGVIAQEVEKVLPELVDSGIDHKTVNYNGIIAVLIQAVKELKVEIEVLKNR